MASSISATDLYEQATNWRPTKKKTTTGNQVRTHPRSAEDLAKILTNPQKFPSPVRPVGSGSSATRCNQVVSGTLIDMTQLDRIVSVKKDTVTVQAGVRLCDLAEHLAADGMELVGGCTDPQRTVGGAVSSGSFGPRLPGDGAQLASTVTQITLVNGEGRRVEVGENLPDLLCLLRMSYGLLGVIYAVTLRIRPIQSYTVSNSKVSMDEFVQLIPNLMEANAAVQASFMPFRDRALVELRYATDDGEVSKALPWKLRDWATHAAIPLVARGVSKAIPVKNLRGSVIDTMVEASHALNKLADSGSNAAEQTGRFKILALNDEKTVSCAWFFPVEQFAAVVPAYRKLCLGHYRNTGLRCDLPADVWRVNQDQHSLLSASFDGPGFVINLRSTAQDGWDDYLLEFAELAAHFKGVPTFNLTKGFKPGYASRVSHGRMQRFRDMRNRLDPRNRLLNQFFAEHIR